MGSNVSREDITLEQILEGVLLAAGEPLMLERLEAVFDDHERPTRLELKAALDRLASTLEGSALSLSHTASGYRLNVHQRLSPWISRLWEERPQRYSRALLETLALIAYRQPVTRADIEDVRGVSVSASIMRTLTERNWVRVIGHRDVPGRPAVYATTRTFLDDFGLSTLDELPPMHELEATEQAGDDGRENDASERLPDEGDADALPETPPTASSVNVAEREDHAEKASTRSSLDFAALGQRLNERRQAREDHGDDETDDDEKSSDDD
ncbi:SMC-Scp complex subunit ScpB [Larsenimonas suaedae]|uniref:SMC-Scp complex subunit ScpB n=1 Tax=Larsenimonas suaedae TaxID=1851019 RepID=A0ABU1GTV7_9GAMM|nr:SMC-Scp complex subunit ScpB [Larsenimonas suaedae]MCM2971902.1 SMC-Scp complex subunit ScpB [Larsenimonas suaedae]MDR5895454.1 SMC-Scp complex subunit ScpB [Larsenimonas suaedae]